MAETTPGVLRGGHLTRIRISSGVFRWYQIYQWPAGSGQYVAYQYNGPEQVKATFGELPFYRTWDVPTFDRVVLAEAPAEEVIGRDGNFGVLANEIMAEAAQDAGVRDPGLAGRLASNAEMQRIMAQAVIGQWTPEQIRAEQRKTQFWTRELYPGIQNLYDLTQNPEQAWAEYQAAVTPYLQTLGYQKDADGTFKTQIAKMLHRKIDAGTFQRMAPTFVQATQNAEFARTLNTWAERELNREIGFRDWFNLMAGEGEPELEALAEKAQLQWVAQNQGADITQQQIENLAKRTQLSAEEAQRAFSEFNQGILALGEGGLTRAGLSRDDILSAAAGVTSKSGKSVDEVKLIAAKVAKENDLFDDEKINFYTGFTSKGAPTRPGLQALAPEGA